MSANVEIIRIDGRREISQVSRHSVTRVIRNAIDADTLDAVDLRDGRVMMVDDTGAIDNKPVNPEATKLYHGVCRPGTTHQIHGDVAIVIDAELA